MSVLVYIKPVCKNTDGTFEYDFFFSDTPDFVWGQFWDVTNPSSNGDMTPEESTYSEIYRVKTNLPLKVIQEISCYSMEYATYGILALGWINIENLETYPIYGRCVMHFGDSFEDIGTKLALYEWSLKKVKPKAKDKQP